MRPFRSQPFIIIFQPRVGSTLLQTLLDSHPRIAATGEPFSPPQRPDADAQIEWMFAYWKRGWWNQRATGFKAQWVDIADPVRLGRLLKQRRARVIRMYRHNTIKMATSLITGEQRHRATGDWNRRVGEPRLSAVHVDPEAFAEILQFTERHRNEIDVYLDFLRLPTLPIAYEDLVLKRREVLEDSFRFLGVRNHEATSLLEKNTSDDLRDVIVNFDELRARYIGTRYEPMFDEVLF